MESWDFAPVRSQVGKTKDGDSDEKSPFEMDSFLISKWHCIWGHCQQKPGNTCHSPPQVLSYLWKDSTAHGARCIYGQAGYNRLAMSPEQSREDWAAHWLAWRDPPRVAVWRADPIGQSAGGAGAEAGSGSGPWGGWALLLARPAPGPGWEAWSSWWSPDCWGWCHQCSHLEEHRVSWEPRKCPSSLKTTSQPRGCCPLHWFPQCSAPRPLRDWSPLLLPPSLEHPYMKHLPGPTSTKWLFSKLSWRTMECVFVYVGGEGVL